MGLVPSFPPGGTPAEPGTASISSGDGTAYSPFASRRTGFRTGSTPVPGTVLPLAAPGVPTRRAFQVMAPGVLSWPQQSAKAGGH